MLNKELEVIKQQILAEIKAAEHILLVGHNHPDGDAVGACLALAHYISSLNKKFTCFAINPVHPSLQFLPMVEAFKHDHSLFENIKFDLLIVLDSGDLQYAGIKQHLMKLKHDYKIINIDHHQTNEMYGHYNLVIHSASSTCEIIHDLLHAENIVNQNIATCLLTGIVTDTNGFINLATTATAIEKASKLLLHGANLKAIAHATISKQSVNNLRLWGRALERLYLDQETGIIITAITKQDQADCGVGSEACEGVANFLSTLEEVNNNIVLVLTERDENMVKVSLRTTSPLLDVAKFARLMGGGGHKKAAGFSLKGSLTKTQYGWKIIKSNINPDSD
jgi:phosphoesterase RecJ-like protein